MIKKNSYKSKKKNFLLFLFLLFFGLVLLVTTKDFRIFVKSEIESTQQHFVTYSGLVRLFDTGEITTNFKGIKSEDILPAIKQIFHVIYDGFINDRNENLD